MTFSSKLEKKRTRQSNRVFSNLEAIFVWATFFRSDACVMVRVLVRVLALARMRVRRRVAAVRGMEVVYAASASALA